MKIKAKILILIIATLVLFFFVAAYYLQTVTAKNNEVILKEDAMKIVKQIEFTFATGGENVSARTMNKNVEEMMYLSSHIISEESARVVKKPDAAISEDRKARIKSSLDENLEKLLYLSSHIARIDILAFHEGGSLSPFFSKVKRAIPYTELSAEEINEARSGRTVLKPEHTSDGKFIDVIAPLYYNGSIYGITEIKLSGDAPERLLTAKRQETMLMAFVVIAVIAAVLIISMDYMVNRPIQNLLSAISEVKGGNLDVSVKGKSQDEFGRLALHFNSMVETIRQSTDEKEQLLKQINRQNDELQYRIDIATEELVQRNEELSYANQSIYDIQKKLGHSRRLAAVGQLAATVAHELGTPLHSVSGHLQLLMEEPGLSDDTNRRLNIMQSQLERIISSIQNILDTTRQPDTRFDHVDLNSLLDDITILLLPETISKHIKIVKDFDESLPLVFGSKGRFEELFLNLIDNAIDACSQNGVISIITKTAGPPHYSLRTNDGPSKPPWAQVTVKDNGRGIPEAFLQDIFKPFYTTKARGQGTGIGLAISQEIVNSHHGFISVESMVDKGSAFTVLLPSTEKVNA